MAPLAGARGAFEHRVGMTRVARERHVLALDRPELIVHLEPGRRPPGLGVTARARGRQRQRRMVGSGRRRVVGHVTALALPRRRVECAAGMTRLARDALVLADDGPELVMRLEPGRAPPVGGVAATACGRQRERRVVGIGGRLEVVHMAALAVARRTGEDPIGVAALASERVVLADDRPELVVRPEVGRLPTRRGVTCATGRRQRERRVVGVARRGVVVHVAALASARGAAEDPTCVARLARDRGVFVDERPHLIVDREVRGSPRSDGVTGGALGRQPERHVPRLGRRLEVVEVASYALARGVREGAARVTRRAVDVRVAADERPDGRMIERRRLPRGGRVAGLAGRCEAARDMVRFGGRREVVGVTADTITRRPCEAPIHVAIVAGRDLMRAGQRPEAVVADLGRAPRRHRVACLACAREASGDVVGLRRGEVGVAVTAVAGGAFDRRSGVLGHTPTGHQRQRCQRPSGPAPSVVTPQYRPPSPPTGAGKKAPAAVRETSAATSQSH